MAGHGGLRGYLLRGQADPSDSRMRTEPGYLGAAARWWFARVLS